MNRILLMAAVSALPLTAFGQETQREPRLTEVKGEVTVHTPDDPDGMPAESDMPLEAGDRVRTGAGSSAEISLDGEHVISLRERTDFTLSRIRRDETELELALGSLLAKIGSLLGSQSLRVRTPAAVASVRGTEFGVEVPEEAPGETYVGVFDEGRVEVAGQTGSPELLLSSQETRVAKGAAPLHAYQLKRFVRHRSFMRAFRKRAQRIRKAWKALPPERRQELRAKAMERMRERRRKMRQRLHQKPEGAERRPRIQRPDERKREQRREEIRRKRRGGSAP